MYDVRRVSSCTDEDIYLFTVEDPDPDRLLDVLSTLGAVDRPVPGADLVTMDEPGFVVSGNLDRGRIKLRLKTTADPSGIRERFERRLEPGAD